MVYSDTTNLNGILQRCEFWTGLGNGTITGDSTLIKIFTAHVNEAFDDVMPLILSYTDKGRWDDNNNTDYPIATLNLVSGQNDYSVKVDGDSLDILRIFDVQILESATAVDYTTLAKITLDHEKALSAMQPMSTDTGIPTYWLERDNVIFLNPNPNYSATNGIKIFYERQENYFVSTDTTKAPGIPKIFHPLLPMIASHRWLIINKQNNVFTNAELLNEITRKKGELERYVSMRNPVYVRMGVATNPERGRRWMEDSNR